MINFSLHCIRDRQLATRWNNIVVFGNSGGWGGKSGVSSSILAWLALSHWKRHSPHLVPLDSKILTFACPFTCFWWEGSALMTGGNLRSLLALPTSEPEQGEGRRRNKGNSRMLEELLCSVCRAGGGSRNPSFPNRTISERSPRDRWGWGESDELFNPTRAS